MATKSVRIRQTLVLMENVNVAITLKPAVTPTQIFHFATKATAPARSQAVCLKWEMAQHKVLAPPPCTNVMLTEHVLSVRHTHNVLVYLIAAMGVDAYADILIMGLVTPPLATYVSMVDASAGITMLVIISIIDIPILPMTALKKMVSSTGYLH